MRNGLTLGCKILATTVLAAIISPVAQAVIIPVSADTEIMTDSGNINTVTAVSDLKNAGATGDMYVGYAGFNHPFKILLRFDLSSLPANVTITSATLHMTPEQHSVTPLNLNLHRLLVSWVEGDGLYNFSPYGTSGATYIRRDKSGTDTWTTPGAASDGNDRVAAASVSFTGNSSDPAVNVISDVSYWYANPAANFGWVMETPDANIGAPYVAYFTKENGSNAAYLDVSYLVPEPASVGLLLLGSALMLRRKKAG